jgi:hypothetical protein
MGYDFAFGVSSSATNVKGRVQNAWDQ